jgi:hypothetical protein
MKIQALLYDQRAVKFWREIVTVPRNSDSDEIHNILWEKFGSLLVEYKHV